MKKIALLLILTSSNLSFANEVTREDYDPQPMVEGNTRVQELMDWHKDHPGEMPPLTEQEKYEHFIKKGMPLPGTGASVVEVNKLAKLTSDQTNKINAFNQAQKIKGYYETVNKKAILLLGMPETAEKEYNQRKSIVYNPYDTHLHEVKNNLAMSYGYKGIPSSLATKVIGFAPESVFVNNGWAGAVEFFIPSFNGVCAFHEVNIQITKSSAFIPKEVATYKVNNKLTTINAEGNNDSGFVYEVEWWDKKFRSTLECASKVYSEDMRNNTIELAKKIDQI